MAYAGLFLQLEAPGDLFRTPILAQEPLDQLPGLRRNTRTIGFALPLEGKFICLLRAIALRPAVALQLARDRALMATDRDGDLRLVVTGFLQAVYLVSLFPGKLRIAHLCASFDLAVEEHAYAIAACS